MCANLYKFSKTPDFHRLSSSQLSYLLSCDYPVDCSEAQVLEIVLDWLQYNWNERIPHASMLLSPINWNEVPGGMAKKTMRILRAKTNNNSLVDPMMSLEISATPTPPQGLVNTRGLELAVVKVGGFSLCGVTNEVTYFLPSIGKWRHLTTIPHVEQCNFGVATLDNELFVVGGCFNQSLQEHIHPFGFRFCPQTNKWSTMAPMQRERCRFSLSVLGGNLYAVGGSSESPDEPVDASPCESYDPAKDCWTPVESLPGVRAQHSAVTLGSRHILITGGLEGEHVLNSCYAFDVRSGSWEQRANLLTPRADHTCLSFDNRIYICGGWYEDDTSRILVSSIDCYDPSSDSWSVVTHVPTPRFHAGVVIVDSCLYVIGGFISDVPFDRGTGLIECFDLIKGQWNSQTDYPQDIWEHVCVPLYIPRCRDDMDIIEISK